MASLSTSAVRGVTRVSRVSGRAVTTMRRARSAGGPASLPRAIRRSNSSRAAAGSERGVLLELVDEEHMPTRTTPSDQPQSQPGGQAIADADARAGMASCAGSAPAARPPPGLETASPRTGTRSGGGVRRMSAPRRGTGTRPGTSPTTRPAPDPEPAPAVCPAPSPGTASRPGPAATPEPAPDPEPASSARPPAAGPRSRSASSADLRSRSTSPASGSRSGITHAGEGRRRVRPGDGAEFGDRRARPSVTRAVNRP